MVEHLKLPFQAADHRSNPMVPRRLEHRFAHRGALEAEERRGRPVGKPYPAGSVDDDQALHHAVEQRRGPLRLLLELGLAVGPLFGQLALVPFSLGVPEARSLPQAAASAATIATSRIRVASIRSPQLSEANR